MTNDEKMEEINDNIIIYEGYKKILFFKYSTLIFELNGKILNNIEKNEFFKRIGVITYKDIRNFVKEYAPSIPFYAEIIDGELQNIISTKYMIDADGEESNNSQLETLRSFINN